MVFPESFTNPTILATEPAEAFDVGILKKKIFKESSNSFSFSSPSFNTFALAS